MRRTWLTPCLLAAALAFAGCGAESDAAAEGVVREVDTQAARVTIEHGDIPGLMQAMTMTFEVSDPKLLEGIAAGDEVDFRVRYADGRYTVTEIAPR